LAITIADIIDIIDTLAVTLSLLHPLILICWPPIEAIGRRQLMSHFRYYCIGHCHSDLLLIAIISFHY
jgi:hypothetical protein